MGNELLTRIFANFCEFVFESDGEVKNGVEAHFLVVVEFQIAGRSKAPEQLAHFMTLRARQAKWYRGHVVVA